MAQLSQRTRLERRRGRSQTPRSNADIRHIPVALEYQAGCRGCDALFEAAPLRTALQVEVGVRTRPKGSG